ncbi:copper resistance system multicopper oxidase [Herminiimonas contaminans]|jgi:CopA family copper-resistance protein|uniref:Copper resistance system multicopper oxidase n=1 Tax=Herminiimonas contaminans TaxID=1111140 RepID=A0ABS0EYP9_9BURK|nr:copper resistance system multicopper oxidase [Herminiimonas contaminans]MBF8179162.1 copper resistance system multicopper oxidase [Herminiimonas contaminans]
MSARSTMSVSRRRFVKGLAAGGVLLGVSAPLRHVLAQDVIASGTAAPVLKGTQFDLVVAESPVNFTGKPAIATTINGTLPAPTLRWKEGETVTIRVTNRLAVSTSIHWHGIILPFQMDGVPGISFNGIAPGETFTYRFKVQQSGTYWYHSHSGFQEQTGMFGAIIIDPAQGKDIAADREHVLLLSDWMDDDPMTVLGRLKKQGDYYNYGQLTAGEFFSDVSKDGWKAALSKRKMWNEMRMNPTDMGDLSAAVLTFLTNGITPAGNWTGLFQKGEKVRLRCINGSGNTFYDVRIPGLKLKVVQVDGINIEPISVDEFRFGPGETCDVIVEPKDDVYTVFSQTMDRTGYALGTLAVKSGLRAPVPAIDKLEWLSMEDMMGDMSNMAGMDHGAMNMGGMSMDNMDMSGMSSMEGDSMAQMPNMAGMDHSAMGMQHGGMAMDHSKHAANADPLKTPSKKPRHASTEYGASTDNRIDSPRTTLNDPGVGLRNNGRRVLTLADMHTIGGPLDPRGPGREIELHLTGNMERYTWSFDGLEFGKSSPVHFKYGERVRVILQNDTMMTHPMHLHGVWSELETPEGEFLARRHTIPVQPAQRISFLVTADALGRWAWHCHLMMHMDAGMFREVIIA